MPVTRRSALSLSRRAFLAHGAALAALPLGARAALGQAADADVIIIGAGAAGIAAARKVAEAGRTYALIEAASRVGGRARTDTDIFGVPFDMGAARLTLPAAQPLSALGKAAGLDVAPAPSGARLYLNGKEANDGEYEDFISAVRRTERAISAAGDAGRDLAAARVVPDLGPWTESARFLAGPVFCAKDLDQVSTVDFARADEREGADLCRQGVGTLVSRLAQGLSVRLDTAARAVELDGRLVTVRTSKGSIQGRVVIIAVPPSIVASGQLRILPGLAPRYRTAFERITLGAYDHIAFELIGIPGGIRPDETVHFRLQGGKGYFLNARINGTALYSLDIGGSLASTLADAPPEATRAFLGEAIAREFGADMAKRIGRWHATRWTKDPLALGAFSCALPGAGNLRRAFTEVAAGRLLFAGEHAHETLWGTVGGAWASGERAARQALNIIGVRTG